MNPRGRDIAAILATVPRGRRGGRKERSGKERGHCGSKEGNNGEPGAPGSASGLTPSQCSNSGSRISWVPRGDLRAPACFQMTLDLGTELKVTEFLYISKKGEAQRGSFFCEKCTRSAGPLWAKTTWASPVPRRDRPPRRPLAGIGHKLYSLPGPTLDRFRKTPGLGPNSFWENENPSHFLKMKTLLICGT